MLVLLVCCIILPASAVVLEVTVKGTVQNLDSPKNSVTIANPLQYGCNYGSAGSPVCTYSAMNLPSLSGTAPDPVAFSIFSTGDQAVATSLGGAGGTWIALAKLFSVQPSGEYVTDIVGDASAIPTQLAGNYSLVLDTNPDCAKCTGTTCIAAVSPVVIRSDGKQVAAKALKPGESLVFNGRNDGSSVNVTFISGQASSESCPQAPKGMVGGVQPVSDYIVKVVPPIGMTAGKAPGSVSASLMETLSPAQPAVLVSSVPPTPAQTQKSPVMSFAAIGALGLVVVLAAARRK